MRSNDLKKELVNLIKMRNKSIFIRSSSDFIISSRLLDQFLNHYNIPSKVIRYSGHSPLMRETKRTYELFEEIENDL